MIAKPLPNTNAPALAKKTNKALSVPSAAWPCRPVANTGRPNDCARVPEEKNAGGALISTSWHALRLVWLRGRPLTSLVGHGKGAIREADRQLKEWK